VNQVIKEVDFIHKANVLIEALPYIRQFSGKTFVIKYGGAAMTDESLKHSVMKDIVLMKYIGIQPVVVHGGGPKISQVMEQMGKKSAFVQGLRVTDIETIEIAEMVLAGSINKEIVQLINQHGGRAVGLCGKDAGLIQAKKHYPQVEDADGKTTHLDIGYVGEIVRVDPELLRSLKVADYIPVIAPNGVGDDGNAYNINADTVAGEVAVALEAEKLILLTDTRGILLDPSDETTLIPTLNTNQIDSYIQDGIIGAGMLPKVEACTTALAASVSKTHIVDGRLKHAMLLEIFTSHGIGTEIVKA